MNATGAREVDKNRVTDDLGDTDAEQAQENAKNCLKGGTLPQESSRRIKPLLPIAAMNLSGSRFKIFREEAAQ